MTPQTQPIINYKALQILENSVSYMAGKPMAVEQNAETFSAEDGANVIINCALSATAYELMPNFTAIL